MGDVDKVPYANQPLDSSGTGTSRRLSSDARISTGQVIAALSPNGPPVALATDEEGNLLVREVEDVPGLTPVSDIPQSAVGGNGTGVLVCALCAAALHEAWITDSRDPLTLPAARWILLFDSAVAPTAGDIPSYAPIGMCAGGTTPLDFLEGPLPFNTGIVIAISTTPNQYTAIVPATDYAITARVLGV